MLKKTKFNEQYIFVVLVIIVSIYSLFFLSFSYVAPGLDQSWLYALSYADQNHLQFGKDIVFTYGPLYYLCKPTHYSILEYSRFKFFIIVLLYFYMFYFYWYYLISLIFKGLVTNIYLKILIFFLLIYFAQINFASFIFNLFLVCIIALILVLDNSFQKPFIHLIYIGSILSVLILTKFSTFPLVISMFGIFFCYSLFFKHSIYKFIILGLAFMFFLFLIWTLLLQDISNLPAYFKFGFYTSKYYNIAMAREYTEHFTRDIRFCFVLMLILNLSLILTAFLRRNSRHVLFILFSIGYLFIVYKYIFVRCEPIHILLGSTTLIFFTLLNIILFFKIRKTKYSLFTFFVFLFCTFCMFLFFVYWPLYKGSNYVIKPAKNIKKMPLCCINNNYTHKLFRKNIEKSKNRFFNFYKFSDKLKAEVGNKTIDVFPTELSICYGYGLNYKPRPTLQSYADYSTELDSYTAAYLSDNSPEYILYSLSSIDGRYPIFDEPKTFRFILNNYTYLSKPNDKFILLKKNRIHKIDKISIINSCTEYNMNSIINIPDIKNKRIFAAIDVQLSIIGKIKNLVFKVKPLYIQFLLKNGTLTKPYRFIFTTANNGVLISEYISDINSLKELFSDNLQNNVLGFKIISNSNDYKEKINIRFVTEKD